VPRREYTSKALRYGMRSQGSHSFTCTPRVHPRYLPSRSWCSFTDPRGMERWVVISYIIKQLKRLFHRYNNIKCCAVSSVDLLSLPTSQNVQNNSEATRTNQYKLTHSHWFRVFGDIADLPGSATIQNTEVTSWYGEVKTSKEQLWWLRTETTGETHG